MAYTPTTWQTGDTITATAMNKIENGIANAGSALIVQASLTNNTLTCDHTVQEIYDAITSGTPVYIAWTYGTFSTDYTSQTYFAPVIQIYTYNYTDAIRVCASVARNDPTIASAYCALTPAIALFQASSVNDYPTYYKLVSPQTSVAQ